MTNHGEFGTPQGGHPPHHSITSSARARSFGGTSRPSALAVLRLMTSSNLIGCWTGSREPSGLRLRPTMGLDRRVPRPCGTPHIVRLGLHRPPWQAPMPERPAAHRAGQDRRLLCGPTRQQCARPLGQGQFHLAVLISALALRGCPAAIAHSRFWQILLQKSAVIAARLLPGSLLTVLTIRSLPSGDTRSNGTDT